MRPGRAVASFDSATGMLRALARFLHGRDVPLIGQGPAAAEAPAAALLGLANRLPRRLKERAYAAGGWAEAVPMRRVGDIRSGDLARWVAGHYPERRSEVAFIGSSNGALVHLAAALAAPWLPQTLLIPVRRHGVHPDEPREDLRRTRAAGEALTAANPDLVLHQMHDANQDRLMIAGMSYFRVKWRRLPEAYRRYLERNLAPGGTLVVADCGLRWPVTRIGPRHVFQHGALGGATPREYHEGGPRVADYLRRYGSPHRRWDYPPVDEESPEAEWGFEPALLPDLEELAARNGWRLARMGFAAPEDLSPVVADLYRAWYRRRGLPADRLLAECFLLLEPYWTLRSGSVPYWLVFNTEPSCAGLAGYVDRAGPFAEIRLMLFSHGVESVGLASAERWREVLARAGKIGVFTGVDTAAYLRDFAGLALAHRELARIMATAPMPPPLEWRVAEEFLAGREEIEWSEAGARAGLPVGRNPSAPGTDR
ncbi:hypothetical protein HNP84_003211 [Thermocatellispora tengchongensis]|uniref:Uncharacterized protein n=1 Tax=Thermocatellispora tengchongensis TaxID=1073253 RepID=A0A840PBU7_9ACTN|nr:hypothetical protein [Thermocatellispora tengchongensis]MBB5133485.1 hypothetical protein [Thermocatellispora tengchongensis]